MRMKATSQWWAAGEKELENDPEYIAEGLALELAVSAFKKMTIDGISRKELADRLDVSRGYVSQILSGKTNMTVLTVCKLAVALGMRPEVRIADPANIYLNESAGYVLGQPWMVSTQMDLYQSLLTASIEDKPLLKKDPPRECKDYSASSQSCGSTPDFSVAA